MTLYISTVDMETAILTNEASRFPVRSKKSKKKKAKKNRKESSSASSSEVSEEEVEEEDPNGVMWVEKTCMDEHVVGPEAPLTHMSQNDRPLE